MHIALINKVKFYAIQRKYSGAQVSASGDWAPRKMNGQKIKSRQKL